MAATHQFSEKEYMVHAHFGIGQIKGIESKEVSGEKTNYYRIQTTDSTFWVPVDQMDNEIMRPLSSPEEIELVIAILERPPQEMSPDHNLRKHRIRTVQRGNTPEEIARLLRDLRARQRDKGKYNLDENSTIRTLKQRLIEEWSMVTGKKAELIAAQLDDLLNNHQEPAKS